MSDIKIFVSHRIDQQSETIDNPLYVNVRCGAVYDKRSPEEIGGMLGDNTGDNISEKRNSFCELTVQYWAWKNVKADYYGLCHYRRYLSFSNQIYPANERTQLVHEEFINKQSIDKYGLSEKMMRPIIEQYDIVTSEVIYLDKINPEKKHFSHYDLYNRGFGKAFTKQYIDLLFDVIADKCPEYLDDAKTYFKQSKAKFCNCYIMKRDLFFKYNEWLFNILFEYEKRIDSTNFSMDQLRMPGFMSEALSGIYYFRLLKEHKYKILETQLVWFMEPAKQKELLPAFPENNIPIVLSSSNEYTPNLSVTMESIRENANPEYNYDFIILNSDLTTHNVKLLNLVFKDQSNFSIRFYNVNKLISNYQFIVHKHVKVQTFYRLLIPSILKNYTKAIYLDCDLVVNNDISLLYNVDISDYCIASVRDVRMASLYNLPSAKYRKYNDQILKIAKPFDYFNAGVMVLNLVHFRKNMPIKELLELASSHDWRFADQDLLNEKCQGSVYYLPLQWNVQISFDETKSEQKAPLYMYNEYLQARKQPYIVHYSGNAMPIRIYGIDMFEYYWKYAKKSPFYEYSMLTSALCYSMNPPSSMFSVSGARKFADKIMPKGTRRRSFAKKLLPKGSLRWRFCKQIYYIIRPKYRPKKQKDNWDNEED